MGELELFRESGFEYFLDMPSMTRSPKLMSDLMLGTGYFAGVPQSKELLVIEIDDIYNETEEELQNLFDLKLSLIRLGSTDTVRVTLVRNVETMAILELQRFASWLVFP